MSNLKLKKRKGIALLVQMVIVCTVMGIISASFVTLQSSYFTGLDAGRTAMQARQVAEAKANEIGVMSYWSLADVARTPAVGTPFEYEVILGSETDLGYRNFQRPVTINVYKPGEAIPRETLIKYPTVRGTPVPKGAITAWAGSVADIPSGWFLCDGNNGTPNLTGRFILGASGAHPIGQTGGEESHVLTIAEMPSHGHSGSTSTAGAHAHNYVWAIPERGWDGDYAINDNVADQVQGTHRDWRSQWTNVEGAHSHSVTIDAAGGGQAHNTMPPYYALCYIMKNY